MQRKIFDTKLELMICRTVISQSIKDKIEGGFGERELIQDKIEGLFDFYITLDHRVVSLVERDEDKFGGVRCCSLLLEMKTS